MIYLSDNPWMFHRDEIDLLEEEIDEIYERHDCESKDSVSQMEDRVLEEQQEIEERFETELILKIGPRALLRPSHVHADPSTFTNEESLDHFLHTQSARDPLYSALYIWTQSVFIFARAHYFEQGNRQEGLFRMYVNVKMIPIKFVLFLEERCVEDVIAKEMANKEASLCLLYLERTIDSLQHLSFLGDTQAGSLFKEGIILERRVRDVFGRNV